MYEFIIKIPDQGTFRDIEVNYEYEVRYYDATQHGGVYVEGSTNYLPVFPYIRIEQPYGDITEEEHEANWIRAIFIYAAGSADG